MPADPTTPLPDSAQPDSNGGDEQAVNLIRQKVSKIYTDEPDAAQEMLESEESPRRSKHQEFMHQLSNSGKNLATVQTEWHNYYQSLPAHEKHQVWQEFYASHAAHTKQPSPREPQQSQEEKLVDHKREVASRPKAKTRAVHRAKKLRDKRDPEAIKKIIRDKVTAGGKLETKHHIQSLLFGLAMGSLVLLIFLFSFFNEVIIAPFIQPSRAQAATPLIINDASVAATAQPEVIIPKINVEIPVDYNQTTTDESQIENALDSGVVHYPTTVKPGETGNTAYFGHSSNNIFNKGKYKFAFVLLHNLEPGDTFYLTYNNKAFVYKVFSRTIVDPSDVGVLGPVSGHTATATLITCDPPGTSLKRLVIVGDQISPDPNGNTQTAQPTNQISSSGSVLPGNGPTLMGRFVRSALGKLTFTALILGIGYLVIRKFMLPQRQAS
jgi:LPXTG-site transpeptidase (sortase) family protein